MYASVASSVRTIPTPLLLWCFLVFANVVDLFATSRAFAMGVGEANPISAWIFDLWGMAGLTLHKLFWLTAVVFLLPYIRGWTLSLLAFACLVYAGLLVIHGGYLAVI